MSGKPRPGFPRKSMPFFANRSSIMSRARSTSGTRPTMTTVVPSRSALTFAAVACSIFCTRDPPGPTTSPLFPRVSTSHSAPAGS